MYFVFVCLLTFVNKTKSHTKINIQGDQLKIKNNNNRKEQLLQYKENVYLS